MAIFQGTIQEFHNHIGPRIRNIVNGYARKERRARNGLCEECGQGNQVLESAHIHGRGRRYIIESVLKEYMRDEFVHCDLIVAERKILEAHDPISDTFRFLCKTCHWEYDRSDIVKDKRVNAQRAVSSDKKGKFDLIFMPSNESAFKAALIKNKKAFVALHKHDGSVDNFIWNARNFKASSNLKGNLYSGYLRGWAEKGIYKAVFSIDPLPL